MEINPLEQVVTASEMAEILKVSPQYIRSQCAKGKFRCRKSGDGVWLIHKASFILPKEENK